MRKILILAANPRPTSRLQLGREVRNIREGLRRARKRDDFDISERWAVSTLDLQRALLDESPQIVHFSGHGEGQAGLCFEDEIGNVKLVSGESLAGLLQLFTHKNGLECVVLNGCYSQVQAQAVIEHVPFVIGMSQAIGDQAAIDFSVGFYDALGNGKSIEFAFNLGKAAMALNGQASKVPILLKNKTIKNIDALLSSEVASSHQDKRTVRNTQQSKTQIKSNNHSVIGSSSNSIQNSKSLDLSGYSSNSAITKIVRVAQVILRTEKKTSKISKASTKFEELFDTLENLSVPLTCKFTVEPKAIASCKTGVTQLKKSFSESDISQELRASKVQEAIESFELCYFQLQQDRPRTFFYQSATVAIFIALCTHLVESDSKAVAWAKIAELNLAPIKHQKFKPSKGTVSSTAIVGLGTALTAAQAALIFAALGPLGILVSGGLGGGAMIGMTGKGVKEAWRSDQKKFEQQVYEISKELNKIRELKSDLGAFL